MENKVYSEVLVISKGLAEVIEDYLNTPGLLCFTEPEDEFVGEWLLECNGVIYKVKVKVSKD